MDITGDLMRGQFHQMCECEFGKQLGHFGADHVRAQNLAILFIRNNFYPARVIAKTQRLAVRLEWETSNLDSVAAFLGLRLSHAKRRDLRMRIRGTRRHFIIKRDRLSPCNILSTYNTHCRTDVRQHQLSCHIANCPDAWNTGLHLLINLHKTALADLDAYFFEPESFGVGTEPDCDQRLIRFESCFLALC